MPYLLIVLMFLLSACGQNDDTRLDVGVISGPEAKLADEAKRVAKRDYGLNVYIHEFTDYAIPNEALHGGSIDLNVYQHLPFLKAAIENRGFRFSVVGKTFIYPMGIYSKKIKQLSELQNSAKVAIPNDPSNGSRALLLLAQAGLISLKDVDSPGVRDISSNPKQLKILELDAAQLPRILDDVSLALINATYATPAGLLANRDALFTEKANSIYANLIVCKTVNQNSTKIQQFLKAYQSPEVVKVAANLFSNQAIVAWQTSESNKK